MLEEVFFGASDAGRPAFPDLARTEAVTHAVLLGLVGLIGVWPRWLLVIIDAATGPIVGG